MRVAWQARVMVTMSTSDGVRLLEHVRVHDAHLEKKRTVVGPKNCVIPLVQVHHSSPPPEDPLGDELKKGLT